MLSQHLNPGMVYRDFIEAFRGSMNNLQRPYIKEVKFIEEDVITSIVYVNDSTKLKSFRTKQIADLSQTCLNYFLIARPSFSLKDRIDLLTTLENSLITCSQRIENSVKHRWWYPILHLFGYQAKCPIWIQNVLNQMKVELPILREQNN